AEEEIERERAKGSRKQTTNEALNIHIRREVGSKDGRGNLDRSVWLQLLTLNTELAIASLLSPPISYGINYCNAFSNVLLVSSNQALKNA
ncbi:hypothetical protein Pcinc_039879, partial [Petrolisthes cinctipes]